MLKFFFSAEYYRLKRKLLVLRFKQIDHYFLGKNCINDAIFSFTQKDIFFVTHMECVISKILKL